MLSKSNDEEAQPESWNSVVVIIDEARPQLEKPKAPSKLRVLPQKNTKQSLRKLLFPSVTVPLTPRFPSNSTCKTGEKKPRITVLPRDMRLVIPVNKAPTVARAGAGAERFLQVQMKDDPEEPSEMPEKPFFDLGNGEWVCSFCYYFTAVKEDLIDHQTREHQDLVKDSKEFLEEKAKEWFCPACSLQCSCSDSFRLHLKRMHPTVSQKREPAAPKPSPKYLCDLCEKVYYDKEAFRKHTSILHLFVKRTVLNCLQKRSRRCEFCGGICDSPESLKNHMTAAHPEHVVIVDDRVALVKSLVCTICWIQYTSVELIRNHLRDYHSLNDENLNSNYRIICRVCDESFETEAQLVEHHVSKHQRVRTPKPSLSGMRSSKPRTPQVEGDKSLICDLCGKKFGQRGNMLVHRERHVLPEHWTKHQAKMDECRVVINGETNWQCQECPRVHDKAEDFVRHLVLHDQPKSFVCHECGFQTTRERLLKRHINTVHLKTRDFKCDFCPLAFGTKRTLEDHRRRHTGERPWACKLCPKTFPNATCLYKHKQSHTDYFPYACEWPGCDVKCRSRQRRAMHMLIHSGARPYSCSMCSKTFRRSGDVKKHETVHTDLRPYSCDICGRSYKHKKYLAFHIKTSHSNDL